MRFPRQGALLAASLLMSPWIAAQDPPRSAELLEGTWELDLARSSFIEREAPRSQVMIFEPTEEGLKTELIFINQDGGTYRVNYVAGDPGAEIPLSGSSSFDAITMQQHGPYRATTTFMHAGQEVGHAERRISMDGREMTVEVVRNGNLSSRAVFIKQE